MNGSRSGSGGSSKRSSIDLEIPCIPTASTTFRRRAKRGGVEGDQTYYLANEERIRGKDKINLKDRPSPGSGDRGRLSATRLTRPSRSIAGSVPEVWVCDESELVILVLQPNGQYARIADKRRVPVPLRGRDLRLGKPAADESGHRMDERVPPLGAAGRSSHASAATAESAAHRGEPKSGSRRKNEAEVRRPLTSHRGMKSMSTVNVHNLPPTSARCSSRPSARARLRAGLLRHDLRGPRLRRDLRDRRPGRVPHPLSALAVRHGVPAALQGLSLRAPEDLRDGHQQRPVLRLSAALQPDGRPEARHGPRLRPQRLLQEQHLVQPDQPQDDGRDGQPRQAHPLVHGAVRRGDRRELHRQLPVAREPDRHLFAAHQAARRAQPLRLRRRRRGEDDRRRSSRARTTWTRSSTRPHVLKEEAEARASPRRRGPSRCRSPSSPSATCCCSSSSTPP